VAIGEPNSRVEHNGSRKSVFETEWTAVVPDFKEPRLPSEVKSVEQSLSLLGKRRHMWLNAKNLSEVMKSRLNKPRKSTCHSPLLKFSLHKVLREKNLKKDLTMLNQIPRQD